MEVYGTSSPWESNGYARRRSSNTTIAGIDPGAEPGAGGQPLDSCKVL